jgi:GR25 family glycosyltransferase involved in LPS biosynthesis
MEIGYINLASRPDRDERFHRLNALQAEDLIRDGVIAEPLNAFTAGALGNALTHKKLWDQCAAATDVLTVAEDDAVFNRYFPEKAPRVIAQLPADWDIILWGWNFDSVLHVGIMGGIREAVMNFDARPLDSRLAEFQAEDYAVQPLRLVNAFGLVSYSVSPAGARRLLAACFPLRKDAIPIPGLNRHLLNISLDATMNKHYRALRSFACFPPLVWTENDKSTSDVAPA